MLEPTSQVCLLFVATSPYNILPRNDSLAKVALSMLFLPYVTLTLLTTGPVSREKAVEVMGNNLQNYNVRMNYEEPLQQLVVLDVTIIIVRKTVDTF